jgi:hypothetical protein
MNRHMKENKKRSVLISIREPDPQDFHRVCDWWVVLIAFVGFIALLGIIAEKHQSNVSRTHQHERPR